MTHNIYRVNNNNNDNNNNNNDNNNNDDNNNDNNNNDNNNNDNNNNNNNNNNFYSTNEDQNMNTFMQMRKKMNKCQIIEHNAHIIYPKQSFSNSPQYIWYYKTHYI